MERLEADLRSLVDSELVVRVAKAADPVKNVWLGGATLARSEESLRNILITKTEYQEHGDAWARKVFAGRVKR